MIRLIRIKKIHIEKLEQLWKVLEWVQHPFVMIISCSMWCGVAPEEGMRTHFFDRCQKKSLNPVSYQIVN
jgi:hypothetical protein